MEGWLTGEAGSPRPLQRCVVTMLTTRLSATPAAAARQIDACGGGIWFWAPPGGAAGRRLELNLRAACFPWPIGMCYGYRTVRTEWEARRAQCGVSGREHVRGRIAVPQGDASGLFSQYAQFAWWIDRCGPRPLAAGLRIL